MDLGVAGRNFVIVGGTTGMGFAAAEQLAQSPESVAALYDAHATFFCTYVAQDASKLMSLTQQITQEALEQEQENIRTAWDWAVRQRRLDLIDASMAALGLFYEQRADTVRGAMVFGDDGMAPNGYNQRVVSAWKLHLHTALRTAPNCP